MKIVCDNCATKYSIADEKVRGKVFKIRCKKCSHIIVVKGTEGGAPAEAGADAGAFADAPASESEAPAGDGWHVVINGEQIGPLTPTELRAKFRAGQIDVETYAWKEGFGDWLRLGSIDDFRDLAPAAPAPSSDATRRTGADDLFAGGEAAPAPAGDLFSAPGGDLFAGAPAPASNNNLFGQAAEPAPARRAPTPGFGSPALTDAPAAAPQDKAMTGQRNENSVLFSLNNLQALASGGGGAKPAASVAVDNRAGFANSQTEGSGLIDIRAMAAATLSSGPSMESRSNDLPAFSSAPVFSPIAAPILMPSAPSGPPRWIWPVIGLGVVAVGSIIVVGVLVLTKKPDAVAVAPVAPIAAPVPGGKNVPPTPTPPSGGTTMVAPTAGTPDKAADKGSVLAPEKGHVAKAAKTPKVDRGGAAPSAKPTKADTSPAAEAPAAPAPKKKKGGDDLDALLNDASPEKPSRAPREERAAANDDNLPDQLDKGAIVGGMTKIKGKVAACYEQYKVPGLANVAVTIGKNGRVSNAAVSGGFAGTPTGDCVSKAVKGAGFPPFKGSPQTINYPFMLR